jgi:hypothetical protein
MNDAELDDTRSLLKKNLKILLYRLAAESESPSVELEAILQDVITELYRDAKSALAVHESEKARRRSGFRLISQASV